MYEDQIARSLDGLELGQPVSHDRLTVFPLSGADRPGVAYLTLDEALAAGVAQVREVSAEGRVPELLFENRGEAPVLLVDGEELVGAKQNRVLNLTILVRPKATVTIPVSCVEAGRWAFSRARRGESAPHVDDGFHAADHAMFLRAKAAKVSQVSASLRATGARASNQSEVWRDVDAALGRLNAASPTRSMSDAFEQKRESVDGFVAALKPQAGQRGAVFMIDGALASVALFDRAATFAKLAAKLVRSHALEVGLGAGGPKGDPLIASLALERVKKLAVEAYPGTDMGRDLRLSGDTMNGAALSEGEAVLHLEAFAKR